VATDDVALFMAMEEEQSAARSWDQDQELDYEQISKKQDSQAGQQSKNNTSSLNYAQNKARIGFIVFIHFCRVLHCKQ